MRAPAILCQFLLLIFLSASALAQDVLVIATEHYPPYEMEQPVDGLRGFDYEVVSRAFEQLQLAIDIRFYPWKRAISYAQQGQVLAILTCARSQERESFILFSDPISTYDDGFYTRKGFQKKDINELGDFKQTRVASVDGYESYKELVAAGADPIAAKDTQMSVKMLAMQRFDYLYLGKQATDFVIKSLDLTEKFEYQSLKQQSFHLCFSKAHPNASTILPRFNEALKALRASGEYRAIHAKYR